MRLKTKKHYSKVVKLLEQHIRIYNYGTIAPVDAMLSGDDSLFLDFGSEWEIEEGRKLSDKKTRNHLYYVLSKLLDDRKVRMRHALSSVGWVNVYELNL